MSTNIMRKPHVLEQSGSRDQVGGEFDNLTPPSIVFIFRIAAVRKVFS